MVVKSPQGAQEIRPPTPRSPSPSIPSPALHPDLPAQEAHSIFLVNVPGHSHIRARRGIRISSIRKHQPQAHLLYHNPPPRTQGWGWEKESPELRLGTLVRGSSQAILKPAQAPRSRPCPPRDPRCQDHTESRIRSAGPGGEAPPRFSISLPMTLYPALMREKEEKEKVGMAVPGGVLSSGSQPWGNCLSLQAKPGSETRGTALRETELGGARSQRAGDGLGASPMLCWISCLLPPGASGPSQASQQAIRGRPQKSGSLLSNPRRPAAPSDLATPLSLCHREPKFKQQRGAHFSEPLWPMSVLGTASKASC